ncbi:MAG: hypothetical protein WKG07_11090 [Hymenobacter sp.]
MTRSSPAWCPAGGGAAPVRVGDCRWQPSGAGRAPRGRPARLPPSGSTASPMAGWRMGAPCPFREWAASDELVTAIFHYGRCAPPTKPSSNSYWPRCNLPARGSGWRAGGATR